MKKIVARALVLCLASPSAVTAQTIRPRFDLQGGQGPSQTLTAADFTWLGDLRVPGGEGQPSNPFTSSALQFMTGRRVAGVNHLLITQAGPVPGFTSGQYAGAWSPVELSDPGGYSQDYTVAPFMPVVTNWGFANGSFGAGTNIYDTYGGHYGKTYDAGGNLVIVGNDANPFNIYPNGMGWHDVSATCCLYISYALPYGAYVANWSLVAVDLTNPGSGPNQTGLTTTTNGPLRACVGVFPFAGAQVCGPVRANFFTDMPDGSMGIGMGSFYTQQGDPLNQGPSLWSGAAWPNMSTPQGFGSTRGSAAYRSTDIVPNVDWLTYYTIAALITPSGRTIGEYPIVAARRPPHVGGGFTNYFFEGGTCASYGNFINCPQSEVDPDQYSGIGAWTDTDIVGGMAWIDGTKNGFISPATLSVGHGWYQTLSAQQISPGGTGTTIIYQRDDTEGWGAVPPFNPSSNDGVKFTVTPANYTTTLANRVTVKYQNDGSSQSLSCTASGKAVTIHLATNGGGTITSTANNVVSIVNSTGACSALISAALYLGPNGDGANTGAGVVALITFDYAGIAVPSGILYLNQGPQDCPNHGVAHQPPTTGPVTTAIEQALLIYKQSSLGQTPDYTPDPNEFLWFHDSWPTMRFDPTSGKIGGLFWDPVERKLYLMANGADNVSIPGAPKPLIHVFHVGGSASPAPVPSPTVPSWSLTTGLVACFFRRRSELPRG